MKQLYALPLVLLLLTSCKDDKKGGKEVIDYAKTDLAFYRLNGKVKSFTEKSFIYTGSTKGANGSETQKSDNDMEFDARGMLTKDKIYTSVGLGEEKIYVGRNKPVKTILYNNGSPFIITDYQRDNKKNATNIIRHDASNHQIDRILMRYEGKNLKEKTTYNNQDNPIDLITYTYDKKGNMTGEDIFMGTQTVQVRAIHEYDDKGHKISEARYSADKLNEKTTYIYEGDKVISKETTDANGVLQYSERYAFDKKGNVTSSLRYEKLTDSRLQETYTYDGNNNVLTFTTAVNNKTTQRVTNKYDSNNNLTSTIATDGAGKTIINNRSYAYEYDSDNNWTKKIVTINGKPAFVVERVINYY